MLQLETFINNTEYLQSSEATGWGDRVVQRMAVNDNQHRATSGLSGTRPSIAQMLLSNSNLSGGFISSSPEREQVVQPRVLVIDDEEFIRELYRDVFESRGMTVFAAQNGEEAVNVFRTLKHKPDIIIMDHRMPGKDGIETTRELLQMDPSVPIIFSSADETVRDEALGAGAVSFWAKPFPVGMLVNAMLDIVEARRKKSPPHYH